MAKKSKTKTASRDPIVDLVCEYMHANHRSMSIDVLLCRPTDALKMGLAIAVKLQRIPDYKADALASLITKLERDDKALEEIDLVCRTALSARKRGDLKRDMY